ncbi:MAG: type II toxin-antitoxin system PemK/MazF family toxin [Ignavibacteriae bacterium]|nr:type II toxin-antitoxin system PemK/MazF family toxin [Ignavibacteriota bacterium]
MSIKQFDIWFADLNPRVGTEPGKIRPVVVVQTNLLNTNHPSTIICPLTTNVKPQFKLLRVHIKKHKSGLNEDCDILIDQIRAIDNKRFVKRVSRLHIDDILRVRENLKIVLDLE